MLKNRLWYIFAPIPTAVNSAYKLTSRQIEVLRLVAQGKRSAEIAEQLKLSKHTIDNHRKNMLRKTGFSSTLELVHWATANGIIKNGMGKK